MLYLFEDFALDGNRRELRRGDRLLAVEPKVFDLLMHLIANRERVVSKDDLIAAIWDGRIVSDSALTTRHQRGPGGAGRQRRGAAADQDAAAQGLPLCRRGAGERSDGGCSGR